jgi:uridine kinase
MYIIGIAGGTGSGKTTVVKKIIEALPTDKVAVIPLDSYYNDTSHLSMEERKKINFDHPNAFDWKLLTQQIQELRENKSVEQPTYSYLISNRLPETIHIEPCEVIIIEGILALWKKELRDLMDLKIFVDADSDERLIRVIQRDIIERGRTTQMVIDRYREVLKPMHEEFIEPTKRHADLIIPLGGTNKRAIHIMRSYILHHVSTIQTLKK